MFWLWRIVLVSSLICAFVGCEVKMPPPAISNPLPPPAKPPVVTIITGTTFRRGNEKCSLLGLKDSSDPAQRQKATALAKEWLKSDDGNTTVVNDDPGLYGSDTVRVVWLTGSSGNPRPCLNTQLARSGLVDIDETSWKGYKFYLDLKSGPEEMHWLNVLRMEADSGRRLREFEERKGK